MSLSRVEEYKKKIGKRREGEREKEKMEMFKISTARPRFARVAGPRRSTTHRPSLGVRIYV